MTELERINQAISEYQASIDKLFQEKMKLKERIDEIAEEIYDYEIAIDECEAALKEISLLNGEV